VVKARSQNANQLRSLVVTAPEGLRARLRGLSTKRIAATATLFCPGERPGTLEATTKFALRSVACRYTTLSEELAALDAQLARLVAETAPDLLALLGVSTDHAATLLVVALKTTPSAWEARHPSPASAVSRQ
jgi:transposase